MTPRSDERRDCYVIAKSIGGIVDHCCKGQPASLAGGGAERDLNRKREGGRERERERERSDVYKKYGQRRSKLKMLKKLYVTRVSTKELEFSRERERERESIRTMKAVF